MGTTKRNNGHLQLLRDRSKRKRERKKVQTAGSGHTLRKWKKVNEASKIERRRRHIRKRKRENKQAKKNPL